MDYKGIDLSIIIPVYNMELYLERCLDSVVAALDGMEDITEVLIINDGSTDNSERIIKRYCTEYVYMKSFTKINGGLSDVKNYGMERARGEFVIFLDSDDYVAPGIYKDMLKKAKEEQADIVVCDLELVYDDESRNTICPCTVQARSGVFEQIIDMTMMPASWNKLVKRDLYAGLSFPVGKNNEDISVTPLVLARANKITVINFPYYKYYQRTGSIQNSRFGEKRFVILETSRLCVERLENEEILIEKKEAIKGSVYLHQVLSLAMYPIRREKIVTRYQLLRKYMLRVEELFPDFWDNFEIKEFVHWDTIMVQISRRISVYLMKHHLYMLLSIFWTPCNILFDCYSWLIKRWEKRK